MFHSAAWDECRLAQGRYRPGAPADLPAWCRMTGHALLLHDEQQHAFWIQAKD